ncbi:MAG: helix-turn-helix domain-containing protein [Planctomycetota bacterium]|nr:helix-turn-helix domain-containing protein [Planctomycetota bacterium]
MTALSEKEFFTIDDVAELLQVSKPTAYRRIAKLKALYRLGCVGQARYPADEVRRGLREMAHEEGGRRR